MNPVNLPHVLREGAPSFRRGWRAQDLVKPPKKNETVWFMKRRPKGLPLTVFPRFRTSPERENWKGVTEIHMYTGDEVFADWFESFLMAYNLLA